MNLPATNYDKILHIISTGGRVSYTYDITLTVQAEMLSLLMTSLLRGALLECGTHQGIFALTL